MPQNTFDNLYDAVVYGLQHYYHDTYDFYIDDIYYYTECVTRSWAVKLCPELYEELYE